MDIKIVSAIGEGPTELSAFDDALLKMGIGNKNLISLSSVIPPNSKVLVLNPNKAQNSDTSSSRSDSPESRLGISTTYGNRLYVVISHQESSKSGDQIYAGLGWVQREDGSGLLVEHHGRSREEVINLINSSLTHMTAARGGGFGKIQYEVIGTEVKDTPKSVIVCAVYQEETW